MSDDNVIGIVGSPRPGGNTDALVDEILRGAREAGAATQKFVLEEMDVRPCRACNRCAKNKRCVQNDDMPTLLDAMKDSQVWVLGTPVYWWGPTAQFKAFMDRWYGVDRSVFRGRRTILAVPLGGGSEAYARHTVGMLRDVLDYLGMEHLSTLLAPGIHGLGSAQRDGALMKRAYETGRDAVEKLR
jgi:multimeric flavodoxin WrbA